MSLRNTRIALGIYMLLILGLSSIPGKSFPDIKFLSYDKLIHFIEYGLFSILFCYSFLPLTFKRSLLILIYAVAFSLLDETLQSFVPGRDASLYDGIADVLGFMAGMILVKTRIKKSV